MSGMITCLCVLLCLSCGFLCASCRLYGMLCTGGWKKNRKGYLQAKETPSVFPTAKHINREMTEPPKEDANNDYTKHGNNTPGRATSQKELSPRLVHETNYTEAAMSSCLRTGGRLSTAFANTLRIRTRHVRLSDVTRNVTPMTCTVSASTSPEKRIRVSMRRRSGSECACSNRVIVSDGKSAYTWYPTCLPDHVFKSRASAVVLQFRVGDVSARFNNEVEFVSAVVELDRVQLSPALGYIQTPGNNEWRAYWGEMDAWSHIHPPPGNATLLSMGRFHVVLASQECTDLVEVFVDGYAMENGNPPCMSSPSLPDVFRTPQIRVHFQSDDRYEFSGFRLMFSYHSKLHPPHRVHGSLWNCSVPDWAEFQRHFLCNVDVECDGGEDEESCFYTGHCGQGYLTLDNRCYSYVSAERKLTWLEASAECTNLGGHLASLNTYQEWESVWEFVRARRTQTSVYIGLRKANKVLPFLYRQSYQWVDETIAFYVQMRKVVQHNSYDCAFVYVRDSDVHKDVSTIHCNRPAEHSILCEFPPRREHEHEHAERGRGTGEKPGGVRLLLSSPLSEVSLAVPHVRCPSGHVTHAFLACDERSSCWSTRRRRGHEESRAAGTGRWGVPSRASCPAPMTSLPATFGCGSGWQRVPYSAVCDHRAQCDDGSDESFCVFPPCAGSSLLQCATSDQCYPFDAFCDNVEQCVDQSDESDCKIEYLITYSLSPPPPAVVSFVAPDFVISDSDSPHQGRPCPPTHFRCPGDGYCLPVYLRCNTAFDCPGREDEAGCETAACPGFYRCRASRVCLHVSSVCDGVRQCPEQDDEVYCQAAPCPRSCSCLGFAFLCAGTFVARAHRELRYLDATGSGMDVGLLSENTMLVYLRLASCGIQSLEGENFAFPNLRHLDLSDNFIRAFGLKHLGVLNNLQVLFLSGNPLSAVFSSDFNVSLTLDLLESIDLSRNPLTEIDLGIFEAFPHLLTLNLSSSRLRKLYRSRDNSLKNIRVLDLSRCRVSHFEKDLISNLSDLETIVTENYRLCCPAVLPATFNAKNCRSPVDLVSSCNNLLASAALRVLFAAACCFAVLGNVANLILRAFVDSESSGSAVTDVFVVHLAVGDVVMGVCVGVVTAADRLYQGSYVLQDTAWRTSLACEAAGFLFLLSSQVSVAMVFLVTCNALILSWQKRVFSRNAARVLCVVVWAECAVLAAVPLLPTPQHWELYGRTAVCFPPLIAAEHLTRIHGTDTFVVAVVIFDFCLVSLAAAGQTYVYIRINETKLPHAPSLATSPVESRVAAEDARRVFSSCVLSTACWIPLCTLAVLVWRERLVPHELHVHAGMAALPASAALRPVFYALGVRGERRRKQRTERLLTLIADRHRHRGRNQRDRQGGIVRSGRTSDKETESRPLPVKNTTEK